MKKPRQLGFYRPHNRVVCDNLHTDPVTGEICAMPSMAKQEFARECDINNVIKGFSASGMFRHVNAKAAQGAYTDLPDAVDFQDSLHQVDAARKAFMSLPSRLRARFANDPAEFLAFSQDPANLAELRTLGLAKPEPAPAPPLEVKVVATEPPAPPQEEKPK